MSVPSLKPEDLRTSKVAQSRSMVMRGGSLGVIHHSCLYECPS